VNDSVSKISYKDEFANSYI